MVESRLRKSPSVIAEHDHVQGEAAAPYARQLGLGQSRFGEALIEHSSSPLIAWASDRCFVSDS